ncbi:MAG TPA: hypothetical protein VMV66_03485 [Candidatus Humimicrobiaceae bacterium]|nr:hypothetical protein [Candidatus Humimicrobiaceae bacterium]
MKILKSKILLSLPLVLLSWEIYIGVLFGFFLSKYLSAKEAGQKNRWWKSLVFTIGSYNLHLHHWLYSLTVLIAILISGLYHNFIPLPQLSFGFLGGAIFHGIYSYRDWYRVVVRHK